MSAFIPANVPIAAGMLLTAPTPFNVLFWQWVNQTYNAGFNYANGNKSNVAETSDLLCEYTRLRGSSKWLCGGV
jgi:hypothetical protein